MSQHLLIHLLRRPLNFLDTQDPEEIRRLVPDGLDTLPRPQKIFLNDESATPIFGFPILVTPRLQELRRALEELILREEQVQVAVQRRQPHDRQAHKLAWERYHGLLTRAVENVTMSSYGRRYPSIFWLYHSLEVATLLKESPRRITREDLKVGREMGDFIKYRILDHFQDRVLTATYDLVNRLAVDTEEVEEELFPRLLRRMFDNVLIFTEDHVSPNLAELNSYFQGSLHIDGREVRSRFETLHGWHAERLRSDSELRQAVTHLLGRDPDADGARLLNRPGYLRFLSRRPGYDAERLPSPELVEVWESLLVKLKEFELFHTLRRFALPLTRGQDGELVHRAQGLGATWMGRREVRLSAATRPMDFMSAWVVDPLVDRFGLIYDITDFSAIVSTLRRAGSDAQDDSFRRMFRFQRRVNRLAALHRMQLEKYLGDGAFFSTRHPLDMLRCAIHLQRYYRQALEEGFPFDRGLRIALNFGQYRLIPLRSNAVEEAERYEFFGHGLVELSRLTTGKTTREIEAVMNLLITQGYPEKTVQRFFSPMLRQNVNTYDQGEESRRFYAYINQNGHLVNEGIVATASYLSHLHQEEGGDDIFPVLYRVSQEGRTYIMVPFEDGAGTLYVGLRKLGMAQLKGLDRLAVYEVVDGAEFSPRDFEEVAGGRLIDVLERQFALQRHGE